MNYYLAAYVFVSNPRLPSGGSFIPAGCNGHQYVSIPLGPASSGTTTYALVQTPDTLPNTSGLFFLATGLDVVLSNPVLNTLQTQLKVTLLPAENTLRTVIIALFIRIGTTIGQWTKPPADASGNVVIWIGAELVYSGPG